MIIDVLGYKLRVEYILGAFVLYLVLSSFMVCSCSRVGVVEGMAMMGADLDWKMGNGVAGSWENRAATHGPSNCRGPRTPRRRVWRPESPTAGG